ncbi:MAG: type II toxin-antitoxin system PemK/MazF family toxin [Bacteroidota bacterium]
MEEGQIILTVFETDKAKKIRPALVLRKAPKYNDYLVCGISSKLYEEVDDFDMLINEGHPDFKNSGLKHDGLIRLFFLGMIREEEILGSIGSVSKATLHTLQGRLADYIHQK